MRQFLRKQAQISLSLQFQQSFQFKPIIHAKQNPKAKPYFKKLEESDIENLDISALSVKLYNFGLQMKKEKVNASQWLNDKTIKLINLQLALKIDSTNYKDKTFLMSFMNDHPKVLDESLQEALFVNIRNKILSDDFVNECPLIDYLGLMLFLVKSQAYKITDTVWIKLVSSFLQYDKELNSYQLGLYLQSLVLLHKRSKQQASNTLNKAVRISWDKFSKNILPQLADMNLYTESLIMQSLCTMSAYEHDVWHSMIEHFASLYPNGFDDYSFTYGLWAIATYSRNSDQDIRHILNEEQIIKYVSENVEKYPKNNQKHLLMTLWSLQHLGYGNDNFWKSIYANQIRMILNSTQKVAPNEIAVIVQILSKQQVLINNDWDVCEKLLVNQLQSKLPDNLLNEKSLVNIIQTFSLHGKGSELFWTTIENYLVEHVNSIKPKGLAIIIYSFINQINVQSKTISWITKNINLAIKQKRLEVSQLAQILWSLTHFKQYMSEIDLQSLKLLITTKDFFSNVKPKDIIQLIWSIGFLKIDLDSSIELILHDKLLDCIIHTQLNESDASQILQSIGNVFQDKTLQYSILNKLLDDTDVELNLNAMSSAITFNISEAQFVKIIIRLKNLKPLMLEDPKFRLMVKKLQGDEKLERLRDQELMDLLANLLKN